MALRYRTDLTAGSLKVTESRIIAGLLLRGVDADGWRAALYEDNVLQARSPMTAKRLRTLIRRRLETMGPGLWQLVRDGSGVVATHACLAAAVKRSPLLGDFLDLVVREQVRLFAPALTHRLWEDYHDREPQISQNVSAKFPAPPGDRASAEFEAAEKSQTSSAFFTLSWSHYVFLISVDNPDERAFYEIEASAGGWTLAELKRQFNSGLYERLALSRDGDAIRDPAREGQIVTEPKDVLKNPYVLEFLGLEERPSYSESDLESAIIDKLEHFLLELGKGFLFEARQKRFTFDEEHFFVDLVFYNRLLRCYVLIDLKIGKLSHQDLGQIQMYVNFFDRHVKTADERPTVGIILCRKKHEALVEITLPEDSSIYASEYQLYLPSKEQLRQKLLDWAPEGTE